MASPVPSPVIKKHKKHKSERKERFDSPSDKPAGLKLILKVGNQGTPEHSTDWNYQVRQLYFSRCGSCKGESQAPAAASSSYSVQGTQDEQMLVDPAFYAMGRSHHKKSKKKKKKKDKGKDRERKHRHHHKEKKRKREDAG